MEGWCSLLGRHRRWGAAPLARDLADCIQGAHSFTASRGGEEQKVRQLQKSLRNFKTWRPVLVRKNHIPRLEMRPWLKALGHNGGGWGNRRIPPKSWPRDKAWVGVRRGGLYRRP